MQPFIGQIGTFGFNFNPKGWAFCNGQYIAISQNSALFSLIGTQFGGDGKAVFALPNLQSRVPVHVGDGTVVGEGMGEENVTLLLSNLPPHNHAMACSTAAANKGTPSDSRYLGQTAVGGNIYGATASATLAPNAVGVAGGYLPHNNIQPCLAINFCIALIGVYPSRN